MADASTAVNSAGQGGAAGSSAGPWGAGIGAGAGLLSGLLAKQKAGTDAGNAFAMSGEDVARAQNASKDLYSAGGNAAAVDPIQGSRIATQEVQNNGILGGLFGNGGTLSQTEAQQKDLSTRGYSLQPEDYEAYGQGAGNIAHEFDNSEQGLSNALASRGLSNSGVAGQQFAGSQGNKFEQLGQLQRGIANDRMQMNMQRLGQNQQFLAQLGNQGANAINQQYGRQSAAEGQGFGEAQAKAQFGQEQLGNMQNQANEQMAQRQGSSTMNDAGRASQMGMSGALAGYNAAKPASSGSTVS